MNQSVTTHDKSWVDPRQGGGQQPTNQQNFYQSSSAQMGVNQQHSPSAREDNTYGQDYIHAWLMMIPWNSKLQMIIYHLLSLFESIIKNSF